MMKKRQRKVRCLFFIKTDLSHPIVPLIERKRVRSCTRFFDFHPFFTPEFRIFTPEGCTEDALSYDKV
jgi:hypothetical protein